MTGDSCQIALPHHLQGKLNLPGGCGGRGQKTRNAGRSPRRIEDVGVIRNDGYMKVGAIQDIEDLNPELHVELFGDPPDVVVLEDRAIQFRSPGSDQSIASEVAATVCRLRESQALSFDVVVRIPRIDQRVAARARNSR